MEFIHIITLAVLTISISTFYIAKSWYDKSKK